jgi:glutathione S-transferase
MPSSRYVIWGSELSPFTLKAEVMCRWAGVDFKLCPAQGRLYENLSAIRRVHGMRSGRVRPDFPEPNKLDELPMVPFLLGEEGEHIFDSSAMGEWLDRQHLADDRKLLPGDASTRFAARIIDEYFDEFGLYMAHHNRWVLSARDNDAGTRLAAEFRSLVPPGLRTVFADRFSARQVRRLPYLFSVASEKDEFYGLAADRRPPARQGFPPTHDLLDAAFHRMLERIEALLSEQDYLLGSRFTIADASAYGQLAPNLIDPSAADVIQLRAPATFAWLRRIARGDFAGSAGRPAVTARHEYLFEEIGETFVPLMEQNEAAYESEELRGANVYNEAAFDSGDALYDGVLRDTPFRSVVKTFQVRVWRSLQSEWSRLDISERAVFPFTCD